MIFFIGFLGLLLLAPYKSVFACSCVPPGPPKEELQKATAVFSGTVVSIDKRKVPDQNPNGFVAYFYVVTFDVEKSWKGVTKKTITVNAGIQGGMCGYPFEDKENYIVYANGSDENTLSTSICSRTNKLIYAQEDLKELGTGATELVQSGATELPARKFGFSYYGGFNFWYYFGIGMFVIGLIALVLIIFLLFKHKQKIMAFLKRRFPFFIAIVVSALIAGTVVYQNTNLQFKQQQKKALEATRSAYSEQIGDLKIENRKLQVTIDELEKSATQQQQSPASALTKEGDDPILQTLIEESPLIAHVKITRSNGGGEFKTGTAIVTAQAEVVEFYKAPFQMKEDIQFSFNRFAYKIKEVPKDVRFIMEKQRVEQGKEYIVFLTTPESAGVGGGVSFTYSLIDHFLSTQPYDRYLEERIMQYASPPKIVTSLGSKQCAELETEIRTMIDNANQCNQNTDCVVTSEFSCHFGPYHLVNKSADLTILRQRLEQYTQSCKKLCNMYELTYSPTQEQLKCIANKCVDTRLPQ